MLEKDFNAIKEYTDKLIDPWLKRTWLGYWKVRVLWRDELFNRETDGHSPDVIATCYADWEYEHATITFSVPAMGRYFEDGVCTDPQFIDYVIAHEIGHIIVNQMREHEPKDGNSKFEEKTCTHIGKALEFTRRQALEESRDEIERLKKELEEARHALANIDAREKKDKAG